MPFSMPLGTARSFVTLLTLLVSACVSQGEARKSASSSVAELANPNRSYDLALLNADVNVLDALYHGSVIEKSAGAK